MARTFLASPSQSTTRPEAISASGPASAATPTSSASCRLMTAGRSPLVIPALATAGVSLGARSEEADDLLPPLSLMPPSAPFSPSMRPSGNSRVLRSTRSSTYLRSPIPRTRRAAARSLQAWAADDHISWPTVTLRARDLAWDAAGSYSVSVRIDGKEKVYGSIP